MDFIIRQGIKILNLHKANRVSCALAENLNPVYTVHRDGITYLFCCPNKITKWRLDTYFSKEPETIEWINSFKADDVLFDIGANIGLYSIYAAKKNIRVIAFEPESQNYALLNRNVYLNKVQDNILCLNIAFVDKDCLDYQYIPVFQTGGAVNCFGRATDENGNTFSPDFKQGVVAYSLDSFLSRYKDIFPSHIKIDVDGLEPKIIEGAEYTLNDKRLKSLSIEINESLPQHLKLIKVIQSKGLLLIQKKHAQMFEGTKYGNSFNYLFMRKP